MTRSLVLRQIYPVLRPLVLLMLLLWADATLAQETPLLDYAGPLKLLEPLDGSDERSLEPEPGIDIFFTYFNMSWPLIVGSAAGIGVLQSLYGGIQIMLSGSDSGRLEEGKSRLLWALAGLIMIGLSGMILETLNPVFFVQT